VRVVSSPRPSWKVLGVARVSNPGPRVEPRRRAPFARERLGLARGGGLASGASGEDPRRPGRMKEFRDGPIRARDS
jgi:hypothetical protein